MEQGTGKAFQRIDIHAHVHFPAYDADRGDVVRRALEAGTAFINIGTTLSDSMAAIDLAASEPEGVYAIVGQHPTETGKPFDIRRFRELLDSPKAVGIGECGLDHLRLPEGGVAAAKSAQEKLFLEHISLANETGKPLMLHIRDAYDDALSILKGHAKTAGDAHFFAGTLDQARAFLDMGFTISFTGVITFARAYEELVEYVPLDMIQAETDSPFVAPVPHRGKRNEPSYVSEVIGKIARIKKMEVGTVEKALMDNARRVFRIGK